MHDAKRTNYIIIIMLIHIPQPSKKGASSGVRRASRRFDIFRSAAIHCRFGIFRIAPRPRTALELRHVSCRIMPTSTFPLYNFHTTIDILSCRSISRYHNKLQTMLGRNMFRPNNIAGLEHTI